MKITQEILEIIENELNSIDIEVYHEICKLNGDSFIPSSAELKSRIADELINKCKSKIESCIEKHVSIKDE